MIDSKNIRKINLIERMSIRATRWIGSVPSLIFHTIIFLSCFLAVIFGTPLEKMLLVLTTIVSLEAIYLSIFIQMSVNRSEMKLRVVSRDVVEIQEDIHEIQEDVENIEKDIDEIQEDVDEIQEDVEGIQEDVEENTGEQNAEHSHSTGHPEILGKIQHVLESLAHDVESLKKKEEHEK